MQVFEDCFTAPTLDLERWATHFVTWGLRTIASNGELQYYVHNGWEGLGVTPHIIRDGRLYLRAEPSPDPSKTGGLPYVSGMISTEQSFPFRYGRVEVRAACPPGRGLWPAIWLLPSDGGDHLPEIDIFEGLGQDPTTRYHFPHPEGGDGTEVRLMGSSMSTGDNRKFHTYGLVWKKDAITWLVDGEIVQIVENFAFSPHYLVINLAVGGHWAGTPDPSTVFPAHFAIQYVRISTLDKGDGILYTYA